MISSADVERRLLRRGLGPRWTGSPPDRFPGLALDSRRVQEGELFCAVAGARVDAHDLLPEVARSGAGAAAVERLVPDVPLAQLVVRDTRQAASHLASLFHGDPGEAVRLVGITGTNGKTTTAWIARHLLSDLGLSAALGTLGIVWPRGERTPGALTTPDPLELMAGLALLRDRGAASVSMEVSSHALEQRRVDALHFDVALYTNLSREHLDYHPGMEAYLTAKLRLVELIAPGGVCAVNADDPAWAPLGEPDRLPEGARLLSYGFSPVADVRAAAVHYGPASSRWRLVTPQGDARVDLPLPGEWNVQNALGAAAVAFAAGIVPGRVAELLGSVPSVPGRMEVLRRRPSLVVRDYAHTPDSFERVLSMLKSLSRGRLIVVFGCGGDRDPGKRPVMGAIAGRLADLSIITTDNPRSEDPEAIASEVVKPMPRERYERVPDRHEAIARALAVAGPEDTVLLAGKGHETYQHIGDRKLPFDEAAIVQELTGDRGAERNGAVRPDAAAAPAAPESSAPELPREGGR